MEGLRPPIPFALVLLRRGPSPLEEGLRASALELEEGDLTSWFALKEGEPRLPEEGDLPNALAKLLGELRRPRAFEEPRRWIPPPFARRLGPPFPCLTSSSESLEPGLVFAWMVPPPGAGLAVLALAWLCIIFVKYIWM